MSDSGNGQTGAGPAASLDELETLIRARYAVLYVITWEERRVEDQLIALAERRNKQLYTWSITSGLAKVGHERTGGGSRSLSDPIEALSAVIDHKEPAIYVFKDFHMFVRPRDCNTGVIRKLREVARALSDSYKTLVITAPVLDIARELEKDVCVIDYPLPGTDEIGLLLHRICEDVAMAAQINIDLDEAGRERLVQAALGLTLQEAENVFAKTIVNDGTLDANDISVVFSEKRQIIRKSGLLDYYESQADLGDVGGLSALKEWLTRRALAFSNEARNFGLPCPKGVLLVGVQGCGKSLCAKAVAQAWHMPLLRFDVGRMFSSLVGSSEENVRRAIAVAEGISPVVLWVDEIDKSLSGSAGSANTDGGTTARVMSTFLTWLSEKTKPVFVLATANSIIHLPPELLRKGRLDEIFFVDLPNLSERMEILRIHLQQRGRDPVQFEVQALAEALEGYSGAEIEEAVISALYDAFYLRRDLTTADIISAIQATVPLSKTMAEEITALRTWAQGRARFASPQAAPSHPAARRKLEIDGVMEGTDSGEPAMSAVVVLTPIVIATWPALSAAVAGAAASMHLAVRAENLHEREETPEQVEVNVAETEIVGAALARDQKIVLERDGVTLEVGRDERGRCTVCASSHGHSKRELEAIAEEVSGRVVQQFIYNKLMTELKSRDYEVVDQERLADESVRVSVPAAIGQEADMSQVEMEIVISRTGQVTVEIQGAKGPRCLKYAELVRELVGREQQRQLTREYYEPDTDVRIDTEVRDQHGQ